MSYHHRQKYSRKVSEDREDNYLFLKDFMKTSFIKRQTAEFLSGVAGLAIVLTINSTPNATLDKLLGVNSYAKAKPEVAEPQYNNASVGSLTRDNYGFGAQIATSWILFNMASFAANLGRSMRRDNNIDRYARGGTLDFDLQKALDKYHERRS